MLRFVTLVAALAACNFMPTSVHGMDAFPGCIDVPLEGDCGETACLKVHGSPFQHFTTTENGYTLCKRLDEASGKTTYHFATVDPNNIDDILCTDEVLSCAQKEPSFSTPPMLRPPPVATEEEQEAGWDESLAGRLKKLAPHERRLQASSVRRLKGLVLLIRFSDHQNLDLPSPEDYEVLISKTGGDPVLAPTGSVQDVFDNSFYGKIQIDYETVGWIDVPYTERQASGGAQSNGEPCGGTCSSAQLRNAITWALNNIDGRLVDISDFDIDGNDRLIDLFTVVHSGFGAETGDEKNVNWVWSHKWQLPRTYTSKSGNVRVSAYNVNPGRWGTEGNEISRPGVLAHEALHFLGLPDLYDTDYSSRGIGSHGLMANSWGIDGSQQYPPSLSPWGKLQLGVIQPQTVNGDGTYTLNPAQLDDTAFFRFDFGRGNDYLLLEYRARLSFDSLSGGGFLLWHMDDSVGSNRNEGYPGSSGWPRSHYMVRLIQMDGLYDLEKNNNRGDHFDFFKAAAAFGANPVNTINTEVSDLTVPSLNGYTNVANSVCSGHMLKDFSLNYTNGDIDQPAPSMTFTYVKLKEDCSGEPENGGDDDDDDDDDNASPFVYVFDCNLNWLDAFDGCDCECVKQIERKDLTPGQRYSETLQGAIDPDCYRSNQRLYCGGFNGRFGEQCNLQTDTCERSNAVGDDGSGLQDEGEREPKEGSVSEGSSSSRTGISSSILAVAIGGVAVAGLAIAGTVFVVIRKHRSVEQSSRENASVVAAVVNEKRDVEDML